MSESTVIQLSVSVSVDQGGRMALRHLSTEDLITELFTLGIEVTEEEKSKGKVFEFLISVCGVNSKLEVNFYC